MATALEFITDALEELGYLGAETPLESTDSDKAFGVFNDMLAEWGESGILPGAAPVANLSDVIRVPRGSHSAIKLNLAGKCASPFRRPITPTLAASIKASNESLLRMTAKIGTVKYPDSLPTGSGNECYDQDRFFNETDETNF